VSPKEKKEEEIKEPPIKDKKINKLKKLFGF
jgi:hypothetical protein